MRDFVSTHTCSRTLIFTVCLVLIAWPLYVYFMLQWYHHRKHFVIRTRWPILSLTIVCGCIGIQLLTIIEASFCITWLTNVSIGLSFITYGLICYRSYLVYAQAMTTRQYLAAKNPLVIQKEHRHFYQTWSKIILFTLLTTSILLIISLFFNTTALTRRAWQRVVIYTVFTTNTLIALVCITNIFRQQVSDTIGITKECIFCVITQLIFGIAAPFLSSLVPPQRTNYFDLLMLVGVFLDTCYGFVTLFTAYYMIRRIERARHSSNSHIHTATGLSLPKLQILSMQSTHSMSNAPVPTTPLPADTRSLSLWMQKPLSIFLNANSENLSVFAGYLSECFSLENILFIERAVILHHFIQKHSKGEIGEKLTTHPCYDLKLTFMTQLYSDIQHIIASCEDDKRGIVTVMKSIYQQFCCRDSDTEINIPYAISHVLHELFETKTDEERLKLLTTYEDLWGVYHEAILECWDMCECLYNFQFKRYLNSKEKKELQLAKHDSLQTRNSNIKQTIKDKTSDSQSEIIRGNISK